MRAGSSFMLFVLIILCVMEKYGAGPQWTHNPHLKVQMRAGGVAGGAGVGNHLTLGHGRRRRRPATDCNGGQRRNAVAVIDDDIIA